MGLSERLGAFPVIETERLRLRELRVEDAPDRFAMLSDPEVMRFLPWFPPATPEANAETVCRLRDAYYAEKPGLNWAITLKGDDRLIGCLKYWLWFGHENRIAELGYEMAREHWGKGIMTEALHAAAGFGIESVGLVRVQLTIDSRNKASARVAAKAGFKEEGTLRSWGYSDRRKEWYDLLMFSMLAGEYRHG